MAADDTSFEHPFEKFRKKLRKQVEEEYEINKGSDFPVHERYTKEEDILSIKEHKKKKPRK